MPYIYMTCTICGLPGKKCSKRSQFPDLCSKCAQNASKVKYNSLHPEERNESKIARRKADPLKARAADKEQRLKNPEAHRKTVRDSAKRYPERIRDRHKAWRSIPKNQIAISARVVEWQKLNPGKVNAIQQNRRARLKGIPGSFTDKEFQSKVESQGGLCYDCGNAFDKTKTGKVTRGHLIPVSQPGSRNDIDNIIAQCQSCNSKQYTKIHPSLDYLLDPALFGGACLAWIAAV